MVQTTALSSPLAAQPARGGCLTCDVPPLLPGRFNVYVSQPEVKPGCVLRRANFNVLERRGLVDSQQVRALPAPATPASHSRGKFRPRCAGEAGPTTWPPRPAPLPLAGPGMQAQHEHLCVCG